MKINLAVEDDILQLHANQSSSDHASLNAGVIIKELERNYNELVNKPSINNVELNGNKTLTDLGIEIPTKVSDLQNDSGYITSAPVASVNGRTGVVSGLQEQLTFDATPTEDSANPVMSGGIWATFMQALNTVWGRIDDIQSGIPTKTSDLTNDIGFLTLGTLPIWDGGVI